MKILVVDDHPLIRQALRNELCRLDEQTIVIEAPDCPAALDLVDAHPDIDVVLLDLNLPGVAGLDALSLVRERGPELPVVVLSATDDRRTVLAAIESGAVGFIPKSSTNEVMLSALRLVLSGGVYLPPAVLEGGAGIAVAGGPPDTGAPSAPAADPADFGLTGRQVEVLALLVQGKSNKQICRELGLAESTVKVHVSAVLKALNVTTRTQAVVAVSRVALRLDGSRAPDSGPARRR